ncbi:aminopeptidase P family protein [Flavobacteriaceae bacterium]|nr:aminopeptidase P family protein [Flavobacteriaceae bacterium]
MDLTLKNLVEAELKAQQLFNEIENKNILIAGNSENKINELIFELAFNMFGIKKYWHKRIVRCGENTLYPYNENPENLILKKDDILFLDFGPIFEEWEADFGRTYVVGNNPLKKKLKNDIEKAWYEGKKHFNSKTKITGAQLYSYCNGLAKKYGWEFGGEIAGHIIGQYPHEKLEKEDKTNYIHPENHSNMFDLNKKGEKKNWILEIHFIDKEKKIGGFFEQLLA